MSMLPPKFFLVKLRLAREPGHPGGDLGHGYDLVVPLDPDGRILTDQWRSHRDNCHVRRFRPGEEDAHGLLSRRRNGKWFFDYDNSRETDDESGFRFEAERFIVGEYVSLREDDDVMHTFQMIAVERS